MESRETSLVIGAGQIGTAVHQIIRRHKRSFIRDLKEIEVPPIHVLHIAIPYTDDFIDSVVDYMEEYNPLLTIVYSTVPIGTCEQIGPEVVHSPVEGRHPDLAPSIRTMPRWLGSADPIALIAAQDFWSELGQEVRPVHSSAFTELIKIRSTAKYGVNLVWADYEKSLADDLGMDFELLKRYDRDYNYLYAKMGQPQFQRYILEPPGGTISGHCVVPNAALLDKDYPHPMLKLIRKMKGKRT